MNQAIKALVDRWPSSLVARAEAGKFSGGAIRGRYLANLDSAGQGPSGAFRIGGKVVYPATNLAEWLDSRARPLKGE
jgi:hypothetical protein